MLRRSRFIISFFWSFDVKLRYEDTLASIILYELDSIKQLLRDPRTFCFVISHIEEQVHVASLVKSNILITISYFSSNKIIFLASI